MVRVFIFILFSFNLFATEADFKYTYDKSFDKGFHLEVFNIITAFEDYDFEKSTDFPEGTIPAIGADEILKSKKGNGLVFLKGGLLAPEDKQYKLIQAETPTNHEIFYLYHTNKVSIAFFNINEIEAKIMISKLNVNKNMSFKSILFSSAYAATTTTKCSPELLNDHKKMSETSEKIESFMLAERIETCALNAFKAAKDQIKSTYELFSDLFTNPAALWEKVKKGYEELKHFVLNFRSEISKIYETLTNLDLDQKLEIACNMVGQSAVSFAMSLTGAGAAIGVTKLIATTLPKIKKIDKISKLIKAKGSKFKDTKGVLSCEI